MQLDLVGRGAPPAMGMIEEPDADHRQALSHVGFGISAIIVTEGLRRLAEMRW
jgi:hypothetical protein